MMPRLWLWLACAAAIVIQYMSHPRAFIINICLDMMTMAGLPQTRQAVPPGARLRHAAAPAQQRAHHALCFINDPGMDNVYIYTYN